VITDRPALAPTSAVRQEQLARVPFFDGLSPRGLQLIADVTSEEEHPLGARIFQLGDPGDRLFMVLEGRVRISIRTPSVGASATEHVLAILGAGEMFGEMALLDESPRSADARVDERCRLLVIKKEDFDDLLFFHKDLAYEVLWSSVRVLSARLRETNERASQIDAGARVPQ
jgi:CRP/FNR family transcriptional regulator, cyclic AMP receptor protein